MILVHERRSVAGSWFANDGVKTVKTVKMAKSGVHGLIWLMGSQAETRRMGIRGKPVPPRTAKRPRSRARNAPESDSGQGIGVKSAALPMSFSVCLVPRSFSVSFKHK